MVLTGFATGSLEEIALLHNILSNKELQDILIDNLIKLLKVKNIMELISQPLILHLRIAICM